MLAIVGNVEILFGIAFWSIHTHKTEASMHRPPEACQSFDLRYDPHYKAMCDAWDRQNP